MSKFKYSVGTILLGQNNKNQTFLCQISKIGYANELTLLHDFNHFKKGYRWVQYNIPEESFKVINDKEVNSEIIGQYIDILNI